MSADHRFDAELRHTRGATIATWLLITGYTALFVVLYFMWGAYIVAAYVNWAFGNGYGITNGPPAIEEVVFDVFWGTLVWVDTIVMVEWWPGTYRYLRHRQPLPPWFTDAGPVPDSPGAGTPTAHPPSTRWDRLSRVLEVGGSILVFALVIGFVVPSTGILYGPTPYVVFGWTLVGIAVRRARRKERERLAGIEAGGAGALPGSIGTRGGSIPEVPGRPPASAVLPQPTEPPLDGGSLPPPPPVLQEAERSWMLPPPEAPRCPSCAAPLGWVPSVGRWFCAEEQRYA